MHGLLVGRLLVSAWVVISKSWGGAPCHAPCSAWSLLAVSLSISLCPSLLHSVSFFQIRNQSKNKKIKYIIRTKVVGTFHVRLANINKICWWCHMLMMSNIEQCEPLYIPTRVAIFNANLEYDLLLYVLFFLYLL